MTDKEFQTQVAFVVETDGLLRDYLDTIVIKRIKSEMVDDGFRDLCANHIHAAMLLKTIAPCALKTFATTMRLSSAAASALVDRMVRAGVVQRRANPDNRREILLSVSPEFDSHVEHVRMAMTQWFATLVGQIGRENFDKWHTAMVALNRVIKKEIQSSTER
ncbi:MAG: MarR family transcriptional regulator [Desulfopila sp.]